MMTRSEAQVGRKVRGASASPMNVWRMRVRDLCVAAMLAFPLMTPLQAESAAAMDGERVWRWMPPFHIQVPASWRPRLDDGGVGYYQGRHPEAKTEDIPAGMSEAELVLVFKDQRELSAEEVGIFADLLGVPPTQIAHHAGVSTPVPGQDDLPGRLLALERKVAVLEAEIARLKGR